MSLWLGSSTICSAIAKSPHSSETSNRRFWPAKMTSSSRAETVEDKRFITSVYDRVSFGVAAACCSSCLKESVNIETQRLAALISHAISVSRDSFALESRKSLCIMTDVKPNEARLPTTESHNSSLARSPAIASLGRCSTACDAASFQRSYSADIHTTFLGPRTISRATASHLTSTLGFLKAMQPRGSSEQ